MYSYTAGKKEMSAAKQTHVNQKITDKGNLALQMERYTSPLELFHI